MSGDLMVLIDHRETVVRLDARALRVERPHRGFERIPLGAVGLVVVHGNPMVSCDVWRALAAQGIPAVLLPARGAGAHAYLGSGLGTTGRLRRLQHETIHADSAAAGIARTLLTWKLEGQARLMEWLGGECPPDENSAPAELPVPPSRPEQPASDFGPRFAVPLTADADSAAGVLGTICRQAENLHWAPNTASMMGIEGAAANAWFGWLAANLPGRWRFHGRNRRPPRDPVNALLSLGYTLAGAEVARAVAATGFDPAAGFLHELVPGRPSLVLDLLEPLRPTVDAVILTLLDAVLDPKHFTTSTRDGCRLNKNGRAGFYAAWAEARMAWPQTLNQAPKRNPRSSEDTEYPRESATLPGQCYALTAWLRRHLGDAEGDDTGGSKDG